MREKRKFVELRKQFPINKKIDKIYIYESFPVKKICGFIEPQEICCFPIAELWKKTKSLSCVGESDFKKYYQGKKSGIGIFFNEFVPLPLTPLTIIRHNAPQSYALLTPTESSVLETLLSREEW